MSEKNVRITKKYGREVININELPEEVKAVLEPQADITKSQAKIAFDGKQFLVRFPSEIAKVMEIQKGDTIEFVATLHAPTTKKKKKLVMTYTPKVE